MGTERGKDWRIEIGDGAMVETHAPVGGEMSFDWNSSRAEIDDSSKDDGDYGSTMHGPRKVSFSFNGVVKLPDAGLERLSDAYNAGGETNIRVVKGAVVKFAGRVSIANLNIQAAHGGAVTWSVSASNKGAPTINDLGAAA